MENNIEGKNSLVTLPGLGVICFEVCDFENPEHLAALVELTNHYMTDPMGDFPPLTKTKQLHLVDGLANHPTAEVHFVILDNTVVALATCFVNFSTFRIKPYLYVHDIVVLKAYRGKSIGRTLMKYLIEKSIERDFCKITLEVRVDNTVAKSLYKSLGFEDSDPNMLFWTKNIN